jgi:hypothetical protein
MDGQGLKGIAVSLIENIERGSPQEYLMLVVMFSMVFIPAVLALITGWRQ